MTVLTGRDFVTGKITRQQADSEFEDDIVKILALINQQIKSVFDELESELDDGKNSHSMKVISSTIQKIRSRYE